MIGGLGAIVGLIGGIAESGLSFFKEREKNKHELAIQKLSIEAMEAEGNLALARSKVETEGKLAVAHVQADAAKTAAEMGAFAESYKHDAKLSGFRSYTRPILTYLLLAATGAYLALGQDAALLKLAGTVMFNLAEMSVAWWFGSRGTKRLIEK